MFYLLLTLHCKTIFRHIHGFQKWLPFLSYFHGPQFAPLPLPGIVVSYPHYPDWPAYSRAICGQNLEALSLPASIQGISWSRFKGVPQRRIEFLTRLTGWFFYLAQVLLTSGGFIWLNMFQIVFFCQYILMRHHGDWVQQKQNMPMDLIFWWKVSEKLSDTIWIYTESNRFFI